MRRLAAALALLGFLPAAGLARDPEGHRLRHRSARKRTALPKEKAKPELDTDLGLAPGNDRDYDGVPDRLEDDPGSRDDDAD